MDQALFDYVSVASAIFRMADDERRVGELVQKYVHLFPGEDREILQNDIHAATTNVHRAINLIFLPLAEVMSASELRIAKLEAMEALGRIIVERDKERRPFWKRVFGGAWFNYRTQPLPARLSANDANITSASLVLIDRFRSSMK